MTNTSTKLPTYFLSHGGGPWPWISEQREMYAPLAASLRAIPAELGVEPRAILCISGHWETAAFTVQTSPQPSMLYDYYGFPAHTYSIQYPASGSPELALRVKSLLDAAGQPTTTDAERGYDHGTFSPLAVVYPEANIRVVQLSIRADYDPAAHLSVGRALAPLRREGVLIVGSGLSYHNLSALGSIGREPSRRFDEWLTETLVDSTPEERVRRLLDWEQAPSARFAHPREDHLIPLMVAVGAAEQEPATRNYHEDSFYGAITASSYCFG
jgi:aromatic ring-opening dioxygenase catalytic subunit (LigB family)